MKLTLFKKQAETSEIMTFFFLSPVPVAWQAGQYLRLILSHKNPDKEGIERYFTISAAPFEQNLAITTRITNSTFKQSLKHLNLGEKLDASGPEGNFTLSDPVGSYVFLAGGIGITPFRSIIQQLFHEKRLPEITLLYANRTAGVAFLKEFDGLSSQAPQFKVKYFYQPEGLDESTIRAAVPDLATPTYYVSGPKVMVESLGKLLTKMGVKKGKIHRDFFPGYDENSY